MLVRYGGGILDARGSIGGQIHSRNRYGAYVRARTTPVNPNSPRQSAIRAIVSSIANLWGSTLTQANRDSWAVFAANVPASNKLGEAINLSGFNQFVKTNVAAVNGGNTAIHQAPAAFILPGEDPDYSTEIDAGTGLITVTFDDTRTWCDEDAGLMIIEMGIPQDSQINFFNGPWRHAGVINGGVVAPATSPDSSLSVPFVVADGQKVWTRAKIQRGDGRTGDWFRDDSIVATA